MFVKRFRKASTSSPRIKSFDSTHPVLPNIALFLNLKEAGSLEGTSRITHKLYENELIWKNIFNAQYGPLYFFEDYKAQYKAFTLHKKICLPIKTKDYNHQAKLKQYQKLLDFITPYDNKPWALFYKAFIAKELHLGKSPREFALEALRLRDFRAGQFLVKELELLLYWRNYVPAEAFTETLGIFLSHENPSQFNREIYFLYCMMHCKTQVEEEKIHFKEKALLHFFNDIDDKTISTQTLVNDFLSLLQLLKITNKGIAAFLRADKVITCYENFLAMIMHIMNTYGHRFQERESIFSWIKSLADKNSSIAAYHYAEYAVEDKNNLFIAKYYYLKALNDGEPRAADGLYALSKKYRHIVTRKELIESLSPHAAQGCMISIVLLSREFKNLQDWHKDVFKIAVMQRATCEEPHLMQVYHPMLKKAQEPEGVLVRCALVFVHLIRNQHPELAKTELDAIREIDPGIMKKYVSTLIKLNFLTPECEKFYKENSISLALEPASIEKKYNLRMR